MQPTDARDLAIGTAPPAGVAGRRLGDAGRWLLASFLAERERWLLWVPVLVGASGGSKVSQK